MKTRIWNKIFIGFLNGMVVILPILITILIIQFIVHKLNDIVLNPLLNLFAPIGGQIDHVYLAKAVILVGVIFLVSLIGWGAKILFINRFFSYWESLLIKLQINYLFADVGDLRYRDRDEFFVPRQPFPQHHVGDIASFGIYNKIVDLAYICVGRPYPGPSSYRQRTWWN